MAKPKHTLYGLECNVEWDHMQPTACGRFCENCSKEVIDFTAWERKEIKKYLREHPQACGHFTAKQVFPGLMPVERLLAKPRWILATWLLLASSNSEAQTGTLPSTEQHIHTPDSGTIEKPVTTVDKVKGDSTQTQHKDTPKSTARRKLFVSRRFPFIHYRKIHPHSIPNMRLTGRYL